MALQNILVIIDARASAEKTLNAAFALAERHSAHLTGIYTVPPVEAIPVYFAAPIPEAVLKAEAEAQASALKKAETLFERLVKEHGWKNRASFHALEGNPVETSTGYARYADLVVMGQQKSLAASLGMPQLYDVAMESGKSVLVIPENGAPAGFSARVLVAWDETREATRAVSDAMILLEDAEFVAVCTIDIAAKPPLLGEEPAIRLAKHLARHKIPAQATYEMVDKGSVGEALLKKAKAADCGMMVMGAYGHSRLRDFMLGSATQDILEAMTIPVLMAH